jgi:protein-S-isoprenylcysteine O-methyltransferase Ste14
VKAWPKTLDDRSFAFLRVLICLDFVLVTLFFLIRLGQQSYPGFLSGCWDVLHDWAIVTRFVSLFVGALILCWAAVVFATNQRSLREDLGHYLAAGGAVITSVAVQFLDFRAMVR